MPDPSSSRAPRSLTRYLLAALAVSSLLSWSASADTSQQFRLNYFSIVQVTFTARAALGSPDDGDIPDGQGPSLVAVSGDAGTHTITMGGRRSVAGGFPKAWAISGAWTSVSGGDTPSLQSQPRSFTFQIILPAGQYTLVSSSGGYSSSVRTPPVEPGGPPSMAAVYDRYYVENFVADVPDTSGSGSTATSAPTPASAAGTYSVTWTASSGGVAMANGSGMSMLVPYPGGQVSFTATARSSDGGIVRRLRIYRPSNGQVLADTSGSGSTLSATASYYASSPDSLRALADVDGYLMTGTETGNLVVPPGAAPMAAIVSFWLNTDTDGQNGITRAAQFTLKNSAGTTVFSRNMTAGPLDGTFVIADPNVSGGFVLGTSFSGLMPPQVVNIPPLPPGTYLVTLRSGHTQSQQLNAGGNPQGRILTMDWGPGEMGVAGGVNPPEIAATLSIEQPPPTPTPTPTPPPVTPPPDADPPTIRWTRPAIHPGTPQPLRDTESCGTTITITADGRDETSLRSIVIQQVSDPMGVTNSAPVVTRLEFPGGTLVGSVSTSLFVRYIPHPSFSNRTYEFTAQAEDVAGNRSALIRLVVVGQDTVVPYSDINAVVVSGAPTPDQAFLGDIRLTGSIIALGDPGTVMDQPGNFPTYFRPDPRYLSGQWLPRVPWLHDMRIERFSLIARPPDAGTGQSGAQGRPASTSSAPRRPTPAPVPGQ